MNNRVAINISRPPVTSIISIKMPIIIQEVYFNSLSLSNRYARSLPINGARSAITTKDKAMLVKVIDLSKGMKPI